MVGVQASQGSRTLIGVISDTHGLLRPQALAALQGVDCIIHAGDVGKPEVLAGLESIAPTYAVRGNVDRGDWASSLPLTQVVQAGDASLYVIHDLGQLNLDPRAAGFQAVISGHSHRASVLDRLGVLYLNPGAAGPRRFSLPVSLALLTVQDSQLEARLVDLSVN